MIQRNISKYLEKFYQTSKKALLLTGARQIGKTFVIREFGKKFKSFVEINFVENPEIAEAIRDAKGREDILFRISTFTKKPLIKGETLIFFDEVQACPEVVTAIKFLVDDGSYKYIMSGSLLGVELKDLRSEPVGYMSVKEMFPLDFEEFIRAIGIGDNVIDHLQNAWDNRTPVDSFIHQKMMELFRLYLVVGGMPEAVKKYLETNNLQEVMAAQRDILTLYKRDITKYDRYHNGFLWLKNAGVAIPVYNVEEPKMPLKLSMSRNLLKLFLSDIGLLAAQYANGIQLRIINGDKDINFGSVYENAVAQELIAHSFEPFYYNNKKRGEIDFVIEYHDRILPIEVKSGKDYEVHRALSNIMDCPDYDLQEAVVLCNDNLKVVGKLTYAPVYMTMCLKKNDYAPTFYKVDISMVKEPEMKYGKED
jgi:hypothetical protein